MRADQESGERCGLEFIHEMRNKESVPLNFETEVEKKHCKGLAASR